jgi:gamma-glutamylcyclotransferase (GGCT)/AIG2-like uncharacterized protein YtfP
MKLIISVLSMIILIGFTSCNQNGKQAKDKNVTEVKAVKSHFTNEGTVQKVLQTSVYTYCLIKVGTDTAWIAISKMPVEIGQTLYYNNGIEMKNFQSKELNRKFASLSLVQEVSTNPSADLQTGNQNSQQAIKPKIVRENISIKPLNGSISIAELYANKAKYEGKEIKVRGKVFKFNTNIMGKNWAHIQDGTEDSGNFDLTVTTLDQVRLGDVVTFEGKITLKKDFGAGYFYPVIMEDAKVVK